MVALSRPGSLRLIFHLLHRPDMVAAPLRHLSDASGIALGAAQLALTALAESGFVTGTRSSRTVVDLPDLARFWLSQYEPRLLPKLSGVTVSSERHDWWIHPEVLDPAVGQLSGEAAMKAMGLPIRPRTGIVYGGPPYPELRKMLRARNDPAGETTFRARFWTVAALGHTRTAPPLVIYADAVASRDDRQIEIAEEMWTTHEDFRRFRAR